MNTNHEQGFCCAAIQDEFDVKGSAHESAGWHWAKVILLSLSLAGVVVHIRIIAVSSINRLPMTRLKLHGEKLVHMPGHKLAPLVIFATNRKERRRPNGPGQVERNHLLRPHRAASGASALYSGKSRKDGRKHSIPFYTTRIFERPGRHLKK